MAINAIESLKHARLTNGVQEKWIEEMKEEAGFQVSQHDEDHALLSENGKDHS